MVTIESTPEFVASVYEAMIDKLARSAGGSIGP